MILADTPESPMEIRLYLIIDNKFADIIFRSLVGTSGVASNLWCEPHGLLVGGNSDFWKQQSWKSETPDF